MLWELQVYASRRLAASTVTSLETNYPVKKPELAFLTIKGYKERGGRAVSSQIWVRPSLVNQAIKPSHYCFHWVTSSETYWKATKLSPAEISYQVNQEQIKCSPYSTKVFSLFWKSWYVLLTPNKVIQKINNKSLIYIIKNCNFWAQRKQAIAKCVHFFSSDVSAIICSTPSTSAGACFEFHFSEEWLAQGS